MSTHRDECYEKYGLYEKIFQKYFVGNGNLNNIYTECRKLESQQVLFEPFFSYNQYYQQC